MAAALRGELALLSKDDRRVLQGAAVAGDPFEPDLAAAAAGVTEEAAIAALDELLGSRPDPAIPTCRGASASGIRWCAARSTRRRRRLADQRAHERAAAALAERGAPVSRTRAPRGALRAPRRHGGRGAPEGGCPGEWAAGAGNGPAASSRRLSGCCPRARPVTERAALLEWHAPAAYSASGLVRGAPTKRCANGSTCPPSEPLPHTVRLIAGDRVAQEPDRPQPAGPRPAREGTRRGARQELPRKRSR